MAQVVPGGTPLPQLSVSEMLKGPQLQRPLHTEPGKCTKDDPQGVAHNGTQGRVHTTYVSARDPAEDRRQRENLQRLQMCMASPFGCGPAVLEGMGAQVQSYGGKFEWGPFKVGGDSDKGVNGGLKEAPEKDGKKKYSLIPKIEGEVCIVRKSEPNAKKGKWGLLEAKAGPLSTKIGLNGGPLCYGFSTTKMGLEGNYTPP